MQAKHDGIHISPSSTHSNYRSSSLLYASRTAHTPYFPRKHTSSNTSTSNENTTTKQTKKRCLNSAGDGGCCLPTTEMVSISLPFYEAAAHSFCSAAHSLRDVEGTRYGCRDRSLETVNIVVHTVVRREVRKENATK